MNMLGNYFVYEPGTRKTSVPHNTRELAEKEACRLCAINPDKRFYVLHAVSLARAQRPVTLEQVESRGHSLSIDQVKYADGDV